MAENDTQTLKGLAGPERLFRQELLRLGVKVDGFIFRPPVDWLPEQYGFRITWPNGKTRSGIIPWDVSTLHTVLDEVRNP